MTDMEVARMVAVQVLMSAEHFRECVYYVERMDMLPEERRFMEKSDFRCRNEKESEGICMNMEIDEVILKSAMSRKQPMTDERLKIIFTYTMYLVAEVLGFGLAFVFILAMAGVFK